MVLKELVLWVCGLERTDFERTHFQQFLHWEGVVILKELILTVSTFGGCGGLQRINFNSFYIGRLWWS